MKKFKFSSTTFVLLILVINISPAASRTWHVPSDAPTIQAGLDSAVAGDIVRVSCGTYYEFDIRMKSGVVLQSETGQADCVTIDARQRDRVIRCRGVHSSTRIEGFTITGGYTDNGGGIYCIEGASPTIRNCIFTGDSATFDGGGVYCFDKSSPSVIDCTFKGNYAYNGGAGLRSQYFSNPTITNCTFSNSWGEGIWCTQGNVIVTNCTFSNNWAYTGAGFQSSSSTASLTDCTFSGNTGDWRGGALYLRTSTVTITNCTFSDNITTGQGAGLYAVVNTTITLNDCSFTDNSANRGGAIFLEESSQGASHLTAENTIFENNTASLSGMDGYIDTGCEARLRCCQTDSTLWTGDGVFILDNDGCQTSTESATWGKIKALYQ